LETNEKSVTVVCACRDEEAHIGTFLEGLSKLDRAGLALDAIVADGMSADATLRILEEFAHGNNWFRVIRNPGRIVSTGLNDAIRLAQGQFIVRMDAHTQYEPDYVIRSIDALEKTGAANAGGPQRSRATGFWQKAIHAGFHSAFASGGAHFRDDNYKGEVDTVPYGCWRRDYLLSVGLFDESLVRNQDDELNIRIRAAGGRVWQDPSIVSWYSPRRTLRGLFRQYMQFGFWRVVVLRKHPVNAAVRHFVPGGVTLAAIVLMALGTVDALRKPVLLIAATAVVAWLTLSAWSAVRAARKEGWHLLPAMPVVFAVYQGAYAIGFCAGLLYWFSNRVPGVFRE
jgi:glycosyltransferase involved in cell wall biosynthesis